MTGDVLPPLFAAAAIALTYVFCVRPMLKGRGCHMMFRRSQAGRESCNTTADSQKPASASACAADSTDAEIARLREEIQLLHHELDLRSGEAPVQLTKEEPR
ncbi:hypothetical protein ABZ313_24230 [Streptomyces sp. NPDC006251]|uniref:hypothetical protein n=1 Tax=Streptomyces sp. NPDC006251 TaxID=3155718 RepID=UPI0033B454BD